MPGLATFRPVLLLALLLSTACSPSLDWRELRPAGFGLVALFPCKPELEARRQPQPMGLASCKAAGHRFSLGWTELSDPAQLGPALAEMPETLAQRLQALPAGAAAPLRVPGMTPQPQARQLRLQGPHGQTIQVAVFARGLRVYQAILQSQGEPQAEAWESFVGGLRFEPEPRP